MFIKIWKIILFIAAFSTFFVGIYFAMRLAVQDEMKEVVSTTIREEFLFQEWKGNVFYNP